MNEAEWLANNDPAAMVFHLTHTNVGSIRRNKPLVSTSKLRSWADLAGCPRCAKICRMDPPIDYAIYVATADCGTSRRISQARLLHEIVGNPFRPVTIPRHATPWLTPTVLSLAQAAYDERQPDGTLDPERLAVLSDALEEAGCDEAALLRHLRGWERCQRCGGQGWIHGSGAWPVGCISCQATGWISSPGPHVRGCWSLDLVLGKE